MEMCIRDSISKDKDSRAGKANILYSLTLNNELNKMCIRDRDYGDLIGKQTK